jgi:hypothetical protein
MLPLGIGEVRGGHGNGGDCRLRMVSEKITRGYRLRIVGGRSGLMHCGLTIVDGGFWVIDK